MAVGPGVVDHKQIPHVHLGQHPVHGELVVVLAQGAGDIVFVVPGGILLAHNGDVVVGPVESGTHQVRGAGVHPDVLLVDVLLVDGPGHQTAVGPQHEPPQLAAEGDVPHAGGHQDLLKLPPDILADDGDVGGLLLRQIGNAHAAGEVDIPNVAAGLLPQLHRQAEENARQLRIVVVGEGVGGQEGVEAEVLDPLLPQAAERLDQLVPSHAVFGVAGGVHHLKPLLAGPQGEHPAGIVAAEHRLRHIAQGLLQEVHQGQVVQVDEGAQLVRQPELLRQSVVGGEHDLPAPEAAAPDQHQLHQAGAVHAAALLPQQLQNAGCGGCLHGKVLLKSLVPGESGLHPPGVFPDTPLIVEVEGGGVGLADLFQLFLCHKRGFHDGSPLLPNHCHSGR